MNRKELVGSGDKIGRLAAPFLMAGIILNIMVPSYFGVGGPSDGLMVVSLAVLVAGVVNWIWSGLLILKKVPRKELITSGPYAIVKHPLYTGMALLVLPWAGFLFNTWLGALVGIVIYVGSRMYSPEEEKAMSRAFGKKWDEYCDNVKIPWI